MPTDPTKSHADYGHIKGMAQYATQHFEEATEVDLMGDQTGDVESNELRVSTGEVCIRCKEPIEEGADVRRTAAGDYEHEVCPFHMTLPD
jgi:hypothetical protein